MARFRYSPLKTLTPRNKHWFSATYQIKRSCCFCWLLKPWAVCLQPIFPASAPITPLPRACVCPTSSFPRCCHSLFLLGMSPLRASSSATSPAGFLVPVNNSPKSWGPSVPMASTWEVMLHEARTMQVRLDFIYLILITLLVGVY